MPVHDVACGPDAVRRGAEAVVHDDPAAPVLDSCPVELEPLDVRSATRRQQDLLDLQLVASHGRDDPTVLSSHALDGRARPDLDPFVLERGRELLGCVGVGPRREPVGALHDRHLRAEAGEDLRELEPDGPTAYD